MADEAATDIDTSAVAGAEGTATGAAAETQEAGKAEGQQEQAKDVGILDGAQRAIAEKTDDVTTPATWPDDWRDKFANKDEKLRKRLDRFTSPENVIKSWLAAEDKIRSGQYKRTLPDGAEEAEIAAYRKEVGIPDDPEKYPLEEPKDVPFTEADKPILSDFKKFAHDASLDPKTANALKDWFFRRRALEVQDYNEQIANEVIERKATLKSEWGAEYDQNIALGNNFLSEVMGEKSKELVNVVLADGTRLGSHPDFVRMVANAARSYASDDLLNDARNGGGGKSVEEAIKESLEVQKADPDKYYSKDYQEYVSGLYQRQAKRMSRQSAA